MNKNTLLINFPAEWTPQDGVMLTWPHKDTDWRDNLDEVIPCFVSIAEEIIKREKLLIVCQDSKEVKNALGKVDYSLISFHEIPSNDTWARDHAPLSIFVNEVPYLLDFTFNGWGLKFPANLDNQITRRLYENNAFAPEVALQDMQYMVLEGGGIENDGKGTLMATSACLLSVNRNDYKDRFDIEDYLLMIFGAERILWLDHGYLAGDDTDSHIDTLARFCNENTIAYVQCTDKNDEHYEALARMEEQLKGFTTKEEKPYHLIPLPMASPVYEDGDRLPATYANFLIINGAILMPTYNSPLDKEAKERLQEAFPDREIININCLPLIRQHGSLHCVTMQFPKGFMKE